MKTSAFDREAPKYDETFTHSAIGRLQRKRVYHFLDQIHFFKSSKKVFEINCGTGYDAKQFVKKGHRVTASDASAQMIEVARKRSSEVQFLPLSFNEIAENEKFQASEVLFSNFGGLNCLSPNDLHDFINQIGAKQKKNDLIIFVIMAKKCLWEDFYFWLKGKKEKRGRRNTSQAVPVKVADSWVKTYYHSPTELKKYLKSNYQISLVRPIAFFLPPSYLEPFFAKQKALLWVLNQMENLFGRFEVLAKRSDHYMIIAKRK